MIFCSLDPSHIAQGRDASKIVLLSLKQYQHNLKKVCFIFVFKNELKSCSLSILIRGEGKDAPSKRFNTFVLDKLMQENESFS